MSETEPCAASIPVAEQQKLDQLILSEHDSLKPHKGDFIASAMRMFIEEEDLAEAYDDLGEIDALLSDLLGGYSRRRRSTATLETLDWEGGTDKLGERIDADLKDRFKTWVHENTDLRYGEAVALAIREKRLDGYEQKVPEQTSHIREQLERIADGEIETELELDGANTSGDSEAATDDESDDESESKPYHEDEKVEKIRTDILDRWPEPVESFEEIEGAKISVAWFIESIDQWCTRRGREEASDRTRNKYLELVADEFGLERDGQNFVVGEIDGLAFERKSFTDLTPDEKVEAVRVELLRRADSNPRGRAQMTAKEIQEDVFDGEPWDTAAHDLRNRAAEADGFGPRSFADRPDTVRVIRDNVTDEDLLEAAGIAAREEIKADAEARMDALDQGTPTRADGGTKSY